jgi:lysophospholipase L1-like esterase
MRIISSVIVCALVLTLAIAPPVKSQTVCSGQVCLILQESGEDTTVSESGNTDSYEIRLDTQPNAVVFVHITDAVSPALVTIEPDELQFTPQDWFTPKTVIVSSVNDLQSDGKAVHLTSLLHTIASADARYQALAPFTVAVWVEDNDCGSWGYLPGDTDFNCEIDIPDLQVMALQWLECTLPNIPTHSAVTPTDRLNVDSWKTRHQTVLDRVAQGNVDLVFVGDSITQFWESTGKTVYDPYYVPRKVVNMGFSGDRTQNVLWRFDNGEINGISPKLAVLMIGTNNSNGDENTAEEIADGIKAICARMRTKMPTMKILILAIFPRGQGPSLQREKNARASELASAIADNTHIFYLNINNIFLNADGTLRTNLFSGDLVHLNAQGYTVWAQTIEPTVKQLMGEN